MGVWLCIEPTGIKLYTNGFGQYRINDGGIIENWALVDGDTIENN